MRRAWLVVVASAMAGGALLAGEFPLHQVFGLRRQAQLVEASLRATRAQNRSLEAEVASLRTKQGIEMAARQFYGLVPSGAKAVVVLPALPRERKSGSK